MFEDRMAYVAISQVRTLEGVAPLDLPCVHISTLARFALAWFRLSTVHTIKSCTLHSVVV